MVEQTLIWFQPLTWKPTCWRTPARNRFSAPNVIRLSDTRKLSTPTSGPHTHQQANLEIKNSLSVLTVTRSISTRKTWSLTSRPTIWMDPTISNSQWLVLFVEKCQRTRKTWRPIFELAIAKKSPKISVLWNTRALNVEKFSREETIWGRISELTLEKDPTLVKFVAKGLAWRVTWPNTGGFTQRLRTTLPEITSILPRWIVSRHTSLTQSMPTMSHLKNYKADELRQIGHRRSECCETPWWSGWENLTKTFRRSLILCIGNKIW